MNLKEADTSSDAPLSRELHAISGWPLTPLTRLDRLGARGCVADLAGVGLLKRQAVFTALACIDIDYPEPFLECLGIRDHGASNIGATFLIRSARDLIGAAFGVEGSAVPTGYLRAVLRIQEDSNTIQGAHPFEDPSSYRRLWEIFTTRSSTSKTNALRYCGTLCSATIKIVDILDPALLHAEVLKNLTTVERAEKANALLRFLRDSISTATDESLFTSLRSSLKGGSSLEAFASKAIEQADRFPAPPLRPSSDVRPLTTAKSMIDFGIEMKNCVGGKGGEVLLGLAYLYRVEHRSVDGTLTILAVELTPLNNGKWMIREIKGAKNRRPDPSILRTVVRRLHDLGAVSPRSSLTPQTRRIASALGVYRWDFSIHDDMEDDETTEVEAA